MSSTEENLEFAFAGESQANRKYLFFADKADEEGYKRIARACSVLQLMSRQCMLAIT